MNLTEKANCGKLKLGFFNRKSTQNGFKPIKAPGSSRTALNSRKNSTPSSNLNWGRSRQSISSSYLHSEASICNEDNRVVLALSEGRGEARCEVGIAVINVSQPHLILCQISDTQSYDNTLRKINIFNPNQILVPMTFVGSANQSRLVEKVKEQFPQITHIPVRRNTYNKTSGMEFIQELCVPSLNSVLLILQYRYYALTAASALFRYLQNNLNIFYASGSIKIEYQESEGYAVIDVSTADRLELVSSTKPLQASKYSTLFGVLNNCYTRIGERALRTILLQPPFATSLILERQECVTALIKHVEKLQSIQVILQKLGNVDQLLTLPTIVIDDSPSCSTRQLNYILYLNGLVDLIITLNDVISTFDQSLFKNISITLRNQDFLIIKDTVRTLINENAYAAKSQNGLFQRCFAIKPGINGLLDLVRKIYSERVDDMREYVKLLGEKYNLPLTLGNNVTKGYHIVFSLNKHQRLTMKKSDIPIEFIQVCRLAGSFTMKTMELINFQTRIDDIVADILKISNVMIFKTLTSFKKHIGLFYRLCEDIAIIDVLQSLAEVSLRNNYVKPTLSDFTEVKESQHPMLHMLVHEKPVPNSISSCQNFNVHIITGPNGSGKSIYIRQVMLLQIMAQIGGYVPASSAVFRPADRLFARVYLEDNMECGASSFVLEMKEILYILSHITDNSLIIIDELARSTSLEEGAALAMAICECFVNSSSFVYLTSHFTLVTKLGDLYLNVKNWFMDTDASGDTPQSMKLCFNHTIKNGVTNLKRYGIYMVKNIWPADLLEDVYFLLEDDNKSTKELKTLQLSKESRLKYNIEADLKKFNAEGKLNPSKVNQVINYYQTKFDTSSSGVDMVNFKIAESRNECFFDDTVPDDALSEAVDQVEYSLLSQDDSNYDRLDGFIRENSGNINLLNPEIEIHESSKNNHDGMIFAGNSSNQRPGNFNQNVRILSNILLNADNNVQENNLNCNDEYEQYSNLRSCSQESYQNDHEFEEVNEINKSLLTEMHNMDRANFEEFNSGTLYEDNLMESNFMDSIEDNYKEKQNTSVQQIPIERFNCFPKPENQDSEFCFLKPTEPPLRKRFAFKNQYPSCNKENLNETDQITFSLDLLRNPDKSSTPTISRNRYSFEVGETSCTNLLRNPEKSSTPTISRNRYSFEVEETSCTNLTDTEINSLNFPSENMFSQENSQSSSNQFMNPAESRPYIFLEDDTSKEEDENKQGYFIRKYNENEEIETSCALEENYQKYGSFLIDEAQHIFPKVNILQGPNNKSLSFGEEDQLLNIPEKSKPKIINEKDVNFEQFVIEETKLFLSQSRDIFEGDIDELEITIENNESNNKSHNEMSDDVIRLLKDEKISSGQKQWHGPIDEIEIQSTQFEVMNKIDNEPENILIEPEGHAKKIESKKDINYFSKSNHLNPNHIADEQNFNRNFKLHNLFEESDLECYLNNGLNISSVQFQTEKDSRKIDNLSSTHENKNCNILYSPKTMIEPTEIKTVSTSLSEISRKRNLDNSSSTSKTTDNQDIVVTDKIKKKADISHKENELKTSIKSSNYVEETVSTSLSEASRRRNLENNCTPDKISEKSDISHEQKDVDELKSSPKPSNYSKSIKAPKPSEMLLDVSNDSDSHSSKGKAVTSISDASRKRNLDNPASSTSSDYQITYIECEEKHSDSSSPDEKLKDLIIPKQNNNYNQALPSSNILNYSENPQKDADSKGNLQEDSNKSSLNYETAEETNISAMSQWRNLEKYTSKETDNSDTNEKKHKTNNEEISEKCMSVSKCSTETLDGISSIKFDSPSTKKEMNRDCNSTLENAHEKTENDVISEKLCHIGTDDSFISSNEEHFTNNESSSTTCLSKQSKKRKYLGYRRRLPKKPKKEEPKKTRDSVKPFKLTKYQIQEEFDKQDQIILEENLDVETYNRYLMQRMNRPSVKQVQNMEHIITFRKTRDGTVVLPPPQEKKYKTRKRMSRKIFESSKMIDVSIFSDQNASKMSAFLASNERNYSQFKFEPDLKGGDGFEDDSPPRCLNFFSQFVQKRKVKMFNRSKSFGDFKFQDYTNINHNNSFKMQVSIPSQKSDSSSIFLPNGFFKENKKDIDNICAKYLLGSQPGFCRTNTSPL